MGGGAKGRVQLALVIDGEGMREGTMQRLNILPFAFGQLDFDQGFCFPSHRGYGMYDITLPQLQD